MQVHLKNLLNSSHEDDIVGALEVILAGNMAGFKKYWDIFTYSFNLIWSREGNIKTKMLEIFQYLITKDKNDLQIILELKNTYNSLNQSFRTAFEEILKNLFENNLKYE